MAGILANSASKTMGAGATSVDNAVTDYVSAERITLSVSPTGTAYEWTFSSPSGSVQAASDLDDDTAASPKFTPDVEGDYSISVTVDGTDTYTLKITVLDVEIANQVQVLRMSRISDASCPTPSAAALCAYHSTQAAGLAYKDSTGKVAPVAWYGSRGANLTDANQTLLVAEGSLRRLPDSVLTDDRTKTLGTTNATIGHVLAIWSQDTSGDDLVILNGGAGAGSWTYTAPVFVVFRYDGTNWAPWTRIDL